MNWTEVKVFTTTEGIEVLTGVLMNLGISGFVVCDPKDFEDFLEGKSGYWDLVDDDLMKLKNDEPHIKIYLADNAQGRETLAMLKTALQGLKCTEQRLGRLEPEITNVAEEDWENGWKKYYKPLRIGKHIVIKPSWEDAGELKGEDLVVELDPGMAFGTGTHETTRMCTELLEKYVKKADEVLDVGCGSGILSIAAAKLGAGSVKSVDIDANSVRIARENAEKNNVGDVLDVEVSDLLDGMSGQYDIVIANIIADVICRLVTFIKPFIKENGVLIVSGIVTMREEDVMNAFAANGFSVSERKNDGDWLAFVLRNGK